MALPHGISEEKRRAHPGTNRGGQQTKARQQQALRLEPTATTKAKTGVELRPVMRSIRINDTTYWIVLRGSRWDVAPVGTAAGKMRHFDTPGQVQEYLNLLRIVPLMPLMWDAARWEAQQTKWKASPVAGALDMMTDWILSRSRYTASPIARLLDLWTNIILTPRPQPKPTAPKPQPKPDLPPAAKLEVRIRDGIRMHEARNARFEGETLIFTNHLGKEQKIERVKLLVKLLAHEIVLQGDRPEWAKLPEARAAQTVVTTRPAPKPRYVYSPTEPSFKSDLYKGGGWIKFRGEFRKWKDVMRLCQCASCGSALSTSLSTETAPGRGKPSVYYQCPQCRAVIRAEADLAPRYEPDFDSPVSAPTVADVLKNYPDLKVNLDEEQEVPF